MKIVTFSKNVFIPLTNACRNRCAYCGFRSDAPQIMSRAEVLRILEEGKKQRCKEALFTFGEMPESSDKIRRQLKEWGYSSVLEYLYELCEDAINCGLLPHSNAGVIERKEMKMLSEVNASLGLMLENASERLCKKGMPHEHSPGKHPKLRLKVLENAGKLKIPFTTGLLVGIDETFEEILYSLRKIKKINDRYGHIQEIIIQNFKAKKNTPMQDSAEPSLHKMLTVVRAARLILPNMNIQVPPNLNPDTWQIFLSFGANDLGGISPTTKDYINPEADWPKIEKMKILAQKLGLKLRERLPVYPEFIKRGWYSKKLEELIKSYVDEDGLVKI
ncbi:MAG: 7,8-didemethyl-8-hydroxy-5-deazariboflavin synthase subunit CofG [Candidatus Hydrothermarchaeota archaeon]|nr:7,8-didemethyl-8-hydroxy-5-deazariboflavin synthase subunit CofG [Candidatus Hydrothermarchaeota archaeon]